MQKKILVVDDDAHTLLMMKNRLVNAGYEVVTADTGQKGINLAKEQKPDLMLLDIMMPDLDGNEVASILAGENETRNIPIVFVTGLLRKDEEKSGKFIGGRPVLAKPYSPEKLLETVKKYMS